MRSVRSLVLAVMALLAFGPLASAQNQPTDFIEVITVTVKPGGVPEYEDYVKKILAGVNKTGAVQRVFGYQVALGGPGSTFTFVLPFNKWGEMDTWTSIPQILSKAYGEAEAGKILKAGNSVVERSQTEVFRTLAQFSTRPKVFDPPTAFAYVVRTEVEPQMVSTYEQYLSKLKAAQEQAPNAPTAIRRVSVQGTASTYVSTQFFNKHAERDEWPSPN